MVDDLERLSAPPDLIHGQHHLETMTALLRFPEAPCVFVCHGSLPWEEEPPRFPRIRRYVAVDEATHDRLAAAGIAGDRIATVLNFVDLERFRPRPPLPPRPRRALAFGNGLSEATALPALRAACAEAGVELDASGLAAGRPLARPESVLPGYDLVFAKGRAALEAMAVGAAVVLLDAERSGPMVTAAELDRLRSVNFGLRALTAPVDAEAIGRQIARYDPADAARVAARVRAEASLEAAVDRLSALYREAAAEPVGRSAAEAAAEARAAADYLAWLNPYLKERGRALIDREALWRRVHELTAEVAELKRSLEGLQRALDGVQGTAVWRARERLVSRAGLVRLYRFLRRLG